MKKWECDLKVRTKEETIDAADPAVEVGWRSTAHGEIIGCGEAGP